LDLVLAQGILEESGKLLIRAGPNFPGGLLRSARRRLGRSLDNIILLGQFLILWLFVQQVLKDFFRLSEIGREYRHLVSEAGHRLYRIRIPTSCAWKNAQRFAEVSDSSLIERFEQ